MVPTTTGSTEASAPVNWLGALQESHSDMRDVVADAHVKIAPAAAPETAVQAEQSPEFMPNEPIVQTAHVASLVAVAAMVAVRAVEPSAWLPQTVCATQSPWAAFQVPPSQLLQAVSVVASPAV